MRRSPFVLTAALFLAAPLSAQQGERFTLAGADVAVYNLVGAIRVVGGESGPVVVEVTRGGPDASRLRVETGAVRGRQTLRVIYPGSEVVAREFGRNSTTRTRVNDDGTFGDGARGPSGRTVTIGGSSARDAVEAWADVTVRVPRGQKLAVHLGVGQATVTNVDGDLLVDVAAARVTTTGTRGRLSLDTGSGDVTVSDAEGELFLDTGSGDVSITRARGRSLVVDAGSGSLTGSDLAVERLSLDLGSGGARLSGVSADEISLDSGSGSVDLALTADVRALDIDSGSGSVTLRVPPSLGALVEVETGSGGVESEIPMTITRRSRSELTGQLGDGRGRIRIEAGSGRVRFLKS